MKTLQERTACLLKDFVPTNKAIWDEYESTLVFCRNLKMNDEPEKYKYFMGKAKLLLMAHGTINAFQQLLSEYADAGAAQPTLPSYMTVKTVYYVDSGSETPVRMCEAMQLPGSKLLLVDHEGSVAYIDKLNIVTSGLRDLYDYIDNHFDEMPLVSALTVQDLEASGR